MDGYEMLDFVIKTFDVSSTDAFCYIVVFLGGIMGGFVFLTNIFMDCGWLLTRGVRKLTIWGYKRFKSKRKEP